jgi:hypothetical protein
MTDKANSKESFFARIVHTLRTWEDALDFSASDHAFARIKALETEVDYLRAELERSRPSARRFFGEP